jgi:glycosyltransferase involved in cell wall biosynthesis
MKILIPMLKFDRAGGWRVLSNLANEWIDMGHEVTMLVYYLSDLPYFPTKATLIWIDERGNQTERSSRVSSSSGKYVKMLTKIYALWQGLNNYAHDFNVIIANESFSTTYPVAFSKTQARKFYYVQAYEPSFYIDLESSNYTFYKKPLANLLMWLLAAASYSLNLIKIVNAPIYLNYKLLKANYYVPPGIDLSLFYPRSNYLDHSDWKQKTVMLGCIGRHEAWKGTKYAIDAYNLLKQAGWNVELSVAYGNIPDGSKLPDTASVTFPKNDEELANYYRSVDIMIAPGTIQLGAPHYPVMEGMACGLAVVTTGYIPAMPGRDNAWIVPIKDAKAIAIAVQEIITDSDLRTKRLSRAITDVQNFSWQAVSIKAINVFKKEIHTQNNFDNI